MEADSGILSGDAVILAGATGRVGGATLQTILGEGARVLVVSRSHETAQRAIAAFAGKQSSDRAIAFEADLVRPGAGDLVAQAAMRHFGRIDAVISLAGGGSRFVAVAESTVEDLETSFRNNLLVAYNTMMPALRHMRTQPLRSGARSRGRLVAVTAGSSRDPQPSFGLMGMGKAGVNLLMLAIAREHKADLIVANAIVMGTVATAAARDYLSAEDFAAAATPQEVADVLAFHASDRSSGINGALIDLNAREVD